MNVSGIAATNLDAIYQTADEVTPGKFRVVARGWGAHYDNNYEYRRRYKNPRPPIYQAQKKFFEQLLAYLKQEDIAVVVVGMPSMEPNRALLPDDFWREFRSYVKDTCGQYRANWIDLTADSQFQKSDFLDMVHLNAIGGIKLANSVAQAISELPANIDWQNDGAKNRVAEKIGDKSL